MDQNTHNYLLRIADNNLILGQRMAQWCGHGPVLEEDIAMTNIALDLIGQATLVYEHLAESEANGRTADDIAFLRDAHQFSNIQLVELPNGDFAQTTLRLFFFSAFQSLLLDRLKDSSDAFISGFAAKAAKETAYHLRHTADWVIRMGDGTAESHRRMEDALTALWAYTGEMLTPDALDAQMQVEGIGPDLNSLVPAWTEKVKSVLEEASLTFPADTHMYSGGKNGRHTEHLGYILAEMQFLPRAYPGLKW